MRKDFLLVSIVASLLIPSIALAATPRTFQELAALVVLIIDNATVVLIVAGIVIYFYGVSTNILNFTDKSGEKLRMYFLWGILVLFVMVSIWGILQLLQNTLFGDLQSNPSSGESATYDPNAFYPDPPSTFF